MAEDGIERRPGRVARLLAVLIDWTALLLMLVAALVVALAWLLLGTQAGRYDVADNDALAAAALVGATVPAWAAWPATRLYLRGATTGQARRGLAIEGAPWRRVVRMLAHPVSAPLWGWLMVTALIAKAPFYALLVPIGIVALAFIVMGLSFLVPSFREAFDGVTRTRLVRRP